MDFTLELDSVSGSVDVVFNGDIPYICLTAASADELDAFFRELPNYLRPDEFPTVEADYSWSSQVSDTEKAKEAARRLVEYLESREPVGRR